MTSLCLIIVLRVIYRSYYFDVLRYEPDSIHFALEVEELSQREISSWGMLMQTKLIQFGVNPPHLLVQVASKWVLSAYVEKKGEFVCACCKSSLQHLYCCSNAFY